MLSEFQQYYVIPGMKVDLSEHECSTKLPGIFLKTSLREILIGRDFRALELLFPLLFAYEGPWTGFSEDTPLIKINVR